MQEIYPLAGIAEPVNSLSHLAAAAFFLYLSSYLLRGRGQQLGHVVSLSVFGFSCVLLLSMSGIYHLLDNDGGAARDVFQRLDHAAIFILIAGTFTAVHYVRFEGAWRWGMIAGVWTASLLGVILKTVYFHDTPEVLGLAAYLGLGSLGLVSGAALWYRYGFTFIKPLVYGGLAYSLGAVLEFFRQPVLIPGVIGPHEVFHVAVLMGIGFHWWFIHSAIDQAHRYARATA